jgi:hypothetical protein
MFSLSNHMREDHDTYADLPETHIAALRAKIFHSVEREFAQVSRIFAARCDEREWYISDTYQSAITQTYMG